MKKSKCLTRALAVILTLAMLGGCSTGSTVPSSSTKEDSKPASSAESSTASADESSGAEDDGSEEETQGEAPEQTKPLIFYCRTNAGRESAPDNQKVLTYIEERTGIQLEINAIANDSFKEKIDLMIASNEVFDGMNLVGYGDTYTTLAQKNVIMPVNDLLDEYGPNVKKAMADGFYSTTDKEGQIWSLPRAERFPEGYVPTIRGDWLEALDMEMPTTIEELEAYFEAVKTTDLNGNGQNDEIPYLPNMLLYGLSNFIPYYLPVKDGNLTSGGFQNLGNIRGLRYMAEDGSIRQVLSHPDFINIIEKFREWYEKGYMPQDIHLLKTAQLTDIRTSGVAGSLGGWYSDGNTPIINWNTEHPDAEPGRYDPIPPLKDAPGQSAWPSNPTYAPQILFMSNAENPETLMRYFDWICSSSENTATVQYGIEGDHWNWAEGEDNTIELTETETQNYIEFYSLANLWWKDLMPTIKVSPDNQAEFMRNAQMTTIRGFEACYPFDAHVPYNYEGTEAEYLTADGGTLLEETIIKMIIGEMELSEWDKTLETYNSIEGDLLSEIWTDQYNDFVG